MMQKSIWQSALVAQWVKEPAVVQARSLAWTFKKKKKKKAFDKIQHLFKIKAFRNQQQRMPTTW